MKTINLEMMENILHEVAVIKELNECEELSETIRKGKIAFCLDNIDHYIHEN